MVAFRIWPYWGWGNCNWSNMPLARNQTRHLWSAGQSYNHWDKTSTCIFKNANQVILRHSDVYKPLVWTLNSRDTLSYQSSGSRVYFKVWKCALILSHSYILVNINITMSWRWITTLIHIYFKWYSFKEMSYKSNSWNPCPFWVQKTEIDCLASIV